MGAGQGAVAKGVTRAVAMVEAAKGAETAVETARVAMAEGRAVGMETVGTVGAWVGMMAAAGVA